MSDDLKQRIILRPIVFNEKSALIAGLFYEIIRPESLDRTFAEGIDVRSYINHNDNMILGRVSAETLRLTREPDGLLAEINAPDTSYSRDVIASINRGDIDGGSFWFQMIEDRWHVEDGADVREILDMRVWECGPVCMPAYLGTDVYVSGPELGRSRASAERQQYHAVHALDFWDRKRERVSGHMESREKELAMLKWPDGTVVERRTAIESAKEFQSALRERFGGIPSNTDGWYWNRSRGWYRENGPPTQGSGSQLPGYNSQDAATRLRSRRLRQLHAMDELAAEQERAKRREGR